MPVVVDPDARPSLQERLWLQIKKILARGTGVLMLGIMGLVYRGLPQWLENIILTLMWVWVLLLVLAAVIIWGFVAVILVNWGDILQGKGSFRDLLSKVKPALGTKEFVNIVITGLIVMMMYVVGWTVTGAVALLSLTAILVGGWIYLDKRRELVLARLSRQ